MKLISNIIKFEEYAKKFINSRVRRTTQTSHYNAEEVLTRLLSTPYHAPILKDVVEGTEDVRNSCAYFGHIMMAMEIRLSADTRVARVSFLIEHDIEPTLCVGFVSHHNTPTKGVQRFDTLEEAVKNFVSLANRLHIGG